MQTETPSARPASSEPPAPTATESVKRPEPGLARGQWEAPTWVFWVMLAAVILGSAAYLLWRMGLLKIKREAVEAEPPSSKARRP